MGSRMRLITTIECSELSVQWQNLEIFKWQHPSVFSKNDLYREKL